MLIHEIFRTIPSDPDLMASNQGRLMRETRWVSMPYGGDVMRGGVPTWGAWDGERYIYQYRGKSRKVARLIAEAWHGPPPFPRAVCMHLDENARNNKPDNLKWGTQKENLNAPGFRIYCRARRLIVAPDGTRSFHVPISD